MAQAKKQQTTSVATTQESMKNITTSLANMKPQLKQVLPPHIDVNKFIRTASAAIQNNPDLAGDTVDRKSLFMACQRAATDGLVIDDRESALVMFNKKAGNIWIKVVQYMPMVAGILKKARNSGEIGSINAYAVYTNDFFEYELGLEPKIIHRPNIDDPGEFRLAYAVAKLKDSSVQLQVMSKAKIEQVRKVSKSGSDDQGNPKGIWKTWYDEMAIKTVLRRLCKFLPSSADLDSVLAASDKQFDINKDKPEEHHQEPEKKPSGQTRAESAILGDEDDDAIDGEVIEDDDPI